MLSKQRVRVVIVNYNGAAMTAKCLVSLARQSYEPLDVVVVDAHSDWGDWEHLQAVAPKHVVLHREAQRAGYSRCINAGARLQGMPPAEFVLAMNNDVLLPDPDTIRCLVNALEADPRRVAASPLIRNPASVKPPEALVQVRRVPDFKTLLIAHSCWLRRLPMFRGICDWYVYGDVSPYPLGRVVDCETINGACFLVRTDFLESIGYLDEGTFLYMEELVLGAQIKQTGCTACLVTSTSVDHLQGASTGLGSGRFSWPMWWTQVRSEFHYVRRYLAKGAGHQSVLACVRLTDAAGKLLQQIFRHFNTARRLALRELF
jgi:GT2 family glycosyltransferase